MNSPRTILLIAFLVVTFYLYQTWLVDQAPGVQQSQQQTSSESVDNATPSGQSFEGIPEGDDQAAPQQAEVTDTSRRVLVSTDVLDVIIDTRGGDLVNAKLNQFAETLDSNERFELLHDERSQLYIAESGLVGTDGTDNRDGRPMFRVEQSEFTMVAGDNLEVPMTLTLEDGSVITKTYTFKPGRYDVDVTYTYDNASDQAKSFQFYGQLKQLMLEGSGNMMMPTYRGTAYSWDENRYEKYDFDEVREQDLNRTTKQGWVAMLEHYFASAWIPREQETARLYSQDTTNNHAIIGVLYPATSVAAGESTSLTSTLFIGPKDQDAMALVAEDLDLTVDYGFLWWLAQPIFKLLQFLQGFLINWGLSIVATTIVIKAILYPLTKAQYVSMAKMRMIQPKMTALRERYGNDRQKMGPAMMKLYKEEKVNPLGGCFPMLLQLPIFLALYWVLLESVELRHAPLFLWIEDLSARDPYFILPILMGVSMFFMQRLQPSPATDPMQQKILQFMPVIFTFFFLWFPSGLVLYWLASNVITIIQMLIIYRGLEKKGLMTRKKKA